MPRSYKKKTNDNGIKNIIKIVLKFTKFNIKIIKEQQEG